MQQHDVAGRSVAASAAASARVAGSLADSVTVRSDVAGASLGLRAARSRAVSSSMASPMWLDDVAGGHRHFALVGLGQLAGGAVQVDGELARGLGVEQLRQPRASMPVSTSPRAAGGHAWIARRIDEHLAVGRRDRACDSPSARRRLDGCVAKSLATPSRLACTSSVPQPSSRAISPGCGVMMIGAVLAAASSAGSSAQAFSASASSTSGPSHLLDQLADERRHRRARARGRARRR